METRPTPGARARLFPPLPIRRLGRTALPLAALALGTCEQDRPVAPRPAPVAAVEAAPRTAILARGRAMQFSAWLRDAEGRLLTERAVTWWSDEQHVATVSASGRVIGVAPGRATITATSDGVSATATVEVVAALVGATTPNLRVAFIGDQDNGSEAVDVLNLIKTEGAHAAFHMGDFDYSDNPTAWDNTITSVLGAGFPYFAAVGNHDESAWSGSGGYQAKLQTRLNLVKIGDPTVSCTGDLGVNSGCYFRGLFFVLSGAGTMGSGHEAYIRQQLGADQSTWRLCAWHKNQEAMQIGGKGDEVGWGPYEACRDSGAIVATAHEHSYSRTKTLTSMQNQTVDAAWPFRDSLRVAPGATFAFVSGLGGNSVRDQERCLPATYPYGCKGEWAFIYTSNQNAQFGALFIDFYVDGDPRKARGYFKNVSGTVVEQFVITSQLTTPDAAPPVVAAAVVDPGSEGQPLNLTATFTDSDEDGPYAATISWGDGSSTAGTVIPATGGGTVSGTHAYADNGAFTVIVSVSDGDGGTGENSGTATVSNVAPTVTSAGQSYAGVEGAAITFTGTAMDPGSADVLTYEWDFDYDGVTFDVEGSGTTASRTHAYAQEGSFTAALRVIDDDQDTSNIATAPVVVADGSPVANFTFTPSSPLVGQVVTFTDQSTSGDPITAREWDFDTGSGLSVDATGSPVTHVYTAAATYTVRLTVRDGDIVPDEAIIEKTVTVTTQPPVILYFSLSSAATLGGTVMDNEDIVVFDGSTFSQYVDGSDVGIGGFTLDAFAIISPTEILMSFTSSGTVPGISGTVQDEDIVTFTATSLGTTTAGTFTLYFDGSDVGLASSSSEDVDAIELLPDGRLLLSTTGDVSVTGVSSGRDEDLLAFTPTSLGDNTAGSFAMYFDGSDVGLSSSSDEDVDAVAVDAAGKIYLSTVGSFSVTGRSGADEDVFVFTPTSLGGTTAGTYSSTLFFDGSVYGVTGDIFAIDLP